MIPIIGVDPGNAESAFVLLREDGTPTNRLIAGNPEIEAALASYSPFSGVHLVIEMVSSMGMAVGKEVFETVYWIGRFAATWDARSCAPARRITRVEIKHHICHDSRAKDANIRQALIDRYGGSKAAAIGLKKTPGPLYGFKSHLWSALAVAVTYRDRMINELETQRRGHTVPRDELGTAEDLGAPQGRGTL